MSSRVNCLSDSCLEIDVTRTEGIEWTNTSVLQLAQGENPVAVIERKARELVLRARDAGWQGPPFNPVVIADLLKIPVEANADVADARAVATDGGVKIEFNPTQARERVRFSIAHEIAHTLFPDVREKVRHRARPAEGGDEWQLEMLCNIAAAEFILPIGSLDACEHCPSIEDLMMQRRKFDVSAEAFLIRVAKTASDPIVMFCASPVSGKEGLKGYRVDYTVPSKTAPAFRLSGRTVRKGSAVYLCTAIGYTDRRTEKWGSYEGLTIECVGIPPFPGSRFPRVAGLIRFDVREARPGAIKTVHGDVLDPRGSGTKIICQLVNDQARVWGGGVARSAAKKFPSAQKSFSDWIIALPRPKRLGEVHFAEVDRSVVVASLVAQAGFGPSTAPRIRYAALEKGLERVREFATTRKASVHMPRIGAGQSGGSWKTVEEIVTDTLIDEGISVTIYDLPPMRKLDAPGLFD
jgi:O-acetyl-ADP-ribose deacetylase (regulator of RNase III)